MDTLDVFVCPGIVDKGGEAVSLDVDAGWNHIL